MNGFVTEQKHIQLMIDQFDSGQRLDTFLSIRYSQFSRTSWQNRIRNGQILLNNQTARPSRILQPSDVINFSFDLKPEPEVDRNIEIVFEDEGFLVIDKPGDLPIHASGSYRKNTLNQVLTDLFISRQVHDFVCRPVHRLDRETSGLIVYAKSREAARNLSDQFISGTVDKQYLVAVFGLFDSFRKCVGFIGNSKTSVIRRKQHYYEGLPKVSDFSCHTEFHLLHQSVADNRLISLLQVQLYTGRMHQIRATLHSIGFPIIGDRMYGPDETIYLRQLTDSETKADHQRLLLPRTALHCSRIQLNHPITQERLTFESKIPPMIANLF